MKDKAMVLAALARELAAADADGRRIPRLTQQYAELDLADAYAIQSLQRDQRRGEGVGIVGYKIGSTMPSKIRQLGLEEPMYGFLTEHGRIADGAELALGELHQPRVEMEFAFVTAEELAGAACDAGTVLAATAHAVPGIEIIDSRYQPGAFDPVAAIADNVSTWRYVLGEARFDPREVDLPVLGGTLYRNGEVIASGTGGAVMGHPAESVAGLIRHLARRGEVLPAGSVVLTGGLSDALPVTAGDRIEARFMGLGRVCCGFV